MSTVLAYPTGMEKLHHGSHRQLLSEVDASTARPAILNAIIVPTMRRANSLRKVMELSREIDCILVALCSGAAAASDVVELGRKTRSNVLAVDVKGRTSRLPALSTTKILKRAGFLGGSDLSKKRNLGLLIARMAGWGRVLFLDDDMDGLEAADAHAAAGWLDEFQAVGLQNFGAPDNSVVCHAYRIIGGAQQQFIGGGALAVSPVRSKSFFPEIYCEDWLYLLGESRPLRLAVTGAIFQRSYDPFADPARAKREELGDSLAEGLYWLLDERQSLERADTSYWGLFLLRRRNFIEHVRKLAQNMSDDQERINASLKAAMGRSAEISPSLCVRYVESWRQDLRTWRRFLGEVDGARTGSLDKALAWLGLADAAYRT